MKFATLPWIGGILLAAMLPLAWAGSRMEELLWGALAGAVLTGSVFFGLAWSFDRSFKLFLGVMSGGMLFKVLLLLISGWVVKHYTDFSLAVYLFATLYYLSLFQVVELRYFHLLRKGHRVHAE